MSEEPADWAVAAGHPEQAKAAEQLAQRVHKPLVPADDENHPFLLVVGWQGLELRQTGAGAPGPLRINFTSGEASRRRRTTGARSPLGRALGLRPRWRPEVVDATAGLGQDAFVMAALGCRMTLLERSLPLFLMLEEALERAAAVPETAEIAARIRLVHADAVPWLEQVGKKPEAIYLDPMYPERSKAALSGKGMQMLQQLLGSEREEEALLQAALAAAGKRVVVKRPKRAAELAGRRANFSIRAPRTRYDIYLAGNRP